MSPLSIVSISLVSIFSLFLWWQGTDGFRAFTSETARRMQVLENPHYPTQVSFTNHKGELIKLEDFQGKLIIADFIYTSCPDICHNLGYAFKTLQKQLAEKDYLKETMILSISFDMERDGQEQLQSYLDRYTKNTKNWQALTVNGREKLGELLKSFAIVTIKNDIGGYDHNAAIHLIDKQGYLFGIYDYQSIDRVFRIIEAELKKS